MAVGNHRLTNGIGDSLGGCATGDKGAETAFGKGNDLSIAIRGGKITIATGVAAICGDRLQGDDIWTTIGRSDGGNNTRPSWGGGISGSSIDSFESAGPIIGNYHLLCSAAPGYSIGCHLADNYLLVFLNTEAKAD